MKVYINLCLHSEYHGYDIFEGVYKSFEEALDKMIFWWAPVGDKLGYVTYTHQDYEIDDEIGPNPIHTHVAFFNKEDGDIITEEVFKNAVLDDNEDNLNSDSEHNYILLTTFVIEEREI